jgi:glutaredoxin 3
MIKVYGKTMCKGCMELKIFLDNSGIKYEYINIDLDPAEKQKLIDKGIMQLPLTVVDGEEFVGWSDGLKEKLLEQL